MGAECAHTDVENGSLQLNMTKMARAFLHAFVTCGALKSTIDGPKTRVTEALSTRLLLCIILLHVNHESSTRGFVARVYSTNHHFRV